MTYDEFKSKFIDFERLTISQKGLGWDFER